MSMGEPTLIPVLLHSCHHHWVKVLDILAHCLILVVLKAKQVEQVLRVFIEAWPDDVHHRLAD